MSRLGHDRERQVRKLLEKQGWWVCRAAGSLGDVDLVALTGRVFDVDGAPFYGEGAILIEVKANKGSPYQHFRRDERARLRDAAELAGAPAYLCHWPPRGKPRWIPEEDWPT